MNIIKSTWLIKTKQIAVLLKRTIHLYSTVPSQIKMLSLPSSFKSSVLISGAWNFRRTKTITSYVSSKYQLFILLNIIVHSFVCCLVQYKQMKKNVNGFVFVSLKIFSCQHIFNVIPDFPGVSLFSLVCLNQFRLYFYACKGLLLLCTVSCPVFTLKVVCS